MGYQLLLGDCIDVLQTLDANSIDSIVCDPPYGLSFMGKDWDHGVPGVAFWEAALRVAKPGAHLLAFGGTRTHHRLMVAIEDAGWEIRDVCMWLYGSGFPKSLDVGKAIDKAAGAEPIEIGTKRSGFGKRNGVKDSEGGIFANSLPEELKHIPITAPTTDAAREWNGWGTALKPAYEPIIMARKPLDGTVAANVLKWGVGGLNVDACRIGVDADDPNLRRNGTARTQLHGNALVGRVNGSLGDMGRNSADVAQGRWPANLLLDEEAARLLDEQSGTSQSKASLRGLRGRHDAGDQSNQRIKPHTNAVRGHNDTGGASRFFYVAKASKRDRDEGLEGMSNGHPTVKPTALCRYLCRLVTPPNGVILDPFMGSGSTLKAAILEGFDCIGIEISEDYYDIAQRRIAAVQPTLIGA